MRSSQQLQIRTKRMGWIPAASEPATQSRQSQERDILHLSSIVVGSCYCFEGHLFESKLAASQAADQLSAINIEQEFTNDTVKMVGTRGFTLAD